jgi:hypothetical protein
MLLAAVLGLLIVWWGGETSPTEYQGREVAGQFMEQIRTGNLDAAWESTTSDFKSDLGRDAFRGFVAARPSLQGAAEYAGSEEVVVHGLTRWRYNFRLASPLPSGSSDVGVLITRDADVWRVEQILAP